MTDLLSDIFETIRIRATLYFRTDFSPPWAITVPPYSQTTRFHLVVRGLCHVTLQSGRTVEVGPGELILIPRGQQHVLADSAARRPAPLEKVIQESGYDGTGAFVLGRRDAKATTQMVCGHFGYGDGADHPLLRALPDFILITAADRARQPLLDEALRLLVRRAFTEGQGTAAAIARLSEVFLIEVVRAGIDRDQEMGKVLQAMIDPQIGKALGMLHADPARAWTVDAIARAVGMSRTRFAERFSNLIGEGPMGYLAEWRLQRALWLLQQPRTGVQAVASSVGYQSAAAFTRAFAKRFGAPPSKYRRSSA